jgi:hypothetical protein
MAHHLEPRLTLPLVVLQLHIQLGANQIAHGDLVAGLWVAPRRQVQVNQSASGPDQTEGTAPLKHEILRQAPIG